MLSSQTLESLEQKKKVAENIISLAELNTKLVDKDDIVINHLTLFLRENSPDNKEIKELEKEIEVGSFQDAFIPSIGDHTLTLHDALDS